MDEMKKLIIDGQEFEVVDAAGRQRITVLENTAPSGGGLSITEKNLILQLFGKAAYSEDDAGTAYETLSNLWTGSYHSVAWEGTGYTHGNSDVAVEDGESFTSTVTANNGKTIESVTVTMGGETVQGAYSSGTITIPNITGDIVITVTTAQMTVSSISAVYTQSGTVYDTDSLDSLKADLVVTATFPDSSTAVIDSADYTLSGTLLEGTSSITVSYGGKTASFNVTVTHNAIYVQTGLIHRWDGIDNTLNGHDGSTTTWYDLVGTDHLVMNQSVLPTWETNALSFPKTAGQRLIGTNDAESVGTQTIELCFLPTESHTAGLFIPLGNTTLGKICIYSDNTFGVNGASGKTYQNPESAITELHHVAAVIENGTITAAYGNATAASLSTKTHSFADPYTKRVLGQANERSNSTSYPFKGKIFAARIYNRALSASEIANNYELDVTRFGLGE